MNCCDYQYLIQSFTAFRVDYLLLILFIPLLFDLHIYHKIFLKTLVLQIYVIALGIFRSQAIQPSAVVTIASIYVIIQQLVSITED